MRPRIALLVLAAVVLASGTAWVLALSLERILLLAPALVIGTGLVLGVFILLGRAAAESIRGLERPRLVVGLIVGGIVLIAVLSVIGIELPRE